MLIRKLTLVTLVFLTAISIVAQQPAAETTKGKGSVISGNLIDEKTNLPVGFATITLRTGKDSSIIRGTYSGENGEFIFGNVSEGSYYLQITYVGYQKKTIPDINVTKDTPMVPLGGIKIMPTDVQLKEVEVKGEKSNIEFRLDKKVINVTQNIASTALTALEILQTQPGVQKDANGDVSIRGSSSFTVLIDGKPSVLSGSDALRQIAASTVESIEIMTNPSAKYDAEGTAGIVNIVTKKQTETLSSGLINAGAGTRGKYSADGTMNYKTGDINLTGGINYRKYTYLYYGNSNMETFMDTGHLFNTSVSNYESIYDNYSIKTGVDYTFNPKSSLTLSLMFGGNNSNFNSQFNYHNWSANTNGYTSIKTINENDSKYFNTALYWNYKFTPNVDELVFEASYTNATLPTGQATNEYIADPSFENTLSILRLRDFITDTKRNEGRLKLNYSNKINSKSTLEVGLQSNFFYKKLDLNNKVFNSVTNNWDITSELTNQYDFRNNIYAAYSTYTNSVFGFDFMLGLRAEITDRLLEQKTMGLNYEYNKMDLFPSLSISTPIGKDQLQFSYSRRIFRPMDYWLNPYPTQSNSFSESRGNPELLPQLSNSFELNYQTSVSGIFLSIQTYLRTSTDDFTMVQSADENGRFLYKWYNIGSSSYWGATISPSFSVTDWLKLDPSLDLMNINQEGIINNYNYKNENFYWMASLNASIIITPDTKIQYTGYLSGKYVTAQSEMPASLYQTVTLKQDFFEKKLSATITLNNINIPRYYEYRTKDINFNKVQISYPEPATITLTLSYNFNNFKRARRPDERVDLSTGDQQ